MNIFYYIKTISITFWSQKLEMHMRCIWYGRLTYSMISQIIIWFYSKLSGSIKASPFTRIYLDIIISQESRISL